jgi:hypothetical protein
MKISIGTNIQRGPWGGGNQFAINLHQYLEKRGIQVCFDLKDPAIDLILLTEPRTQLRVSAFGSHEILRYLLLKNPNALVVHRVNECDERKVTHNINPFVLSANRTADYTVFVSNWLKNLYVQLQFNRSNCVILNGANTETFHEKGYQPWDGKGTLKLVTHHWGGNWLKGFDIYQQLDQLMKTLKYKDLIGFTYIGQLPKGFRFSHATYKPPLFGEMLADSLRQNHVYLTASRNEPGSNHQNEGACCGLPLLYIQSGSLPEYCEGFGIPFQPDNFEKKLDEMIDTYEEILPRMADFPHTAHRMCTEYELLFQELLDRRLEIISKRTFPNQPLIVIRAFLPKLPTAGLIRKTKKVFERWTGLKN